MRTFHLPILLLFAGCTSHERRVQGFLDAGWYGEACREAMEAMDVDLQQEIRAATFAAAAPRLRVHVAGADDFGGRLPRGYGEEWLLVVAALQVERMPFARVHPELALVGADGVRWTACPDDECDADWLAERLIPEDDAVAEAPVVGTSPSGRRGGGGGGLAGLGRLFLGVAQVVALPIALVLDMTLQPVALLAGDKLPSFTLLTLGAGNSWGTAPHTSTTTAGVGSPWCQEQDHCVRRWLLRPETPGVPEAAEVTLRWAHVPDCGTRGYSVELPLVAGEDLGARLQTTLDDRPLVAP